MAVPGKGALHARAAAVMTGWHCNAAVETSEYSAPITGSLDTKKREEDWQTAPRAAKRAILHDQACFRHCGLSMCFSAHFGDRCRMGDDILIGIRCVSKEMFR